jgi:hypothetical protein
MFQFSGRIIVPLVRGVQSGKRGSRVSINSHWLGSGSSRGWSRSRWQRWNWAKLRRSAGRRLLDGQLLGGWLRWLLPLNRRCSGDRKVVGLGLEEGARRGEVWGRSRVVTLLKDGQLLVMLLKTRRGSNTLLLEAGLGSSTLLLEAGLGSSTLLLEGRSPV